MFLGESTTPKSIPELQKKLSKKTQNETPKVNGTSKSPRVSRQKSQTAPGYKIHPFSHVDVSCESEGDSDDKFSTKSGQSGNGQINVRHSILMRNYDTEKASRRLTTNLNLKLKNEKCKFEETSERKIVESIETIKEQEEVIESALSKQTADIQKRLNARKMQSMVKKSRNISQLTNNFDRSILDFLRKEDERSFNDIDGLLSALKPNGKPV